MVAIKGPNLKNILSIVQTGDMLRGVFKAIVRPPRSIASLGTCPGAGATYPTNQNNQFCACAFPFVPGPDSLSEGSVHKDVCS